MSANTNTVGRLIRIEIQIAVDEESDDLLNDDILDHLVGDGGEDAVLRQFGQPISLQWEEI